MTETLLALLESYGYPIVFAAAMLENVFIVGMFMPGQAIVLAAGLASRFSDLNPLLVAGAAAAGEVVGNGISLLIGRHFGRPLFDSRAQWLERRGIDLEEARRFVDEHGPKGLVLGRPAWGFKNVLPTLVGAAGMSPWKALGYILVASAVYYPALVGVGWLAGLGFEQAAQYAGWLGAVLAVMLVAAAVLAWRRLARRQGPGRQ